jgi:hypothetical protein
MFRSTCGETVNLLPASRIAAAICAVLMLAGLAAADDIDLFNAAIEDFSTHNRAALGYLRTETIDLATLEMERMRESWGALAGHFGGARPQAYRDNPLYVTAMVDVQTRLIGGFLMLKMNRPDLAGDALVAIRKEISELRRASHVEVLADCVLDANAAMDALFAYRDQPDWNASQAVAGLTVAAQAYGTAVQRCDTKASADIRSQPEFRRLVDGIAVSLALMPKAIAERNADLLRQLLGELRSFDNRLALRYG